MYARISIDRGEVTRDVYVTVYCTGDVEGDDFTWRTCVVDDELSQVVWEAGQLAHAWWRHGLLGFACLEPKMFEWRQWPLTAAGGASA